MLACESGHEAIVKLLLEAGASLISAGKVAGLGFSFPRTALIHCFYYEMLIWTATKEKGASTSAIFIAAGSGHTSICKLLLQHGATVNASDEELNTPLMYACRMGQVIKCCHVYVFFLCVRPGLARC
jgi:ankyrin repeat protein